jgi:hypothetical protein
MSPPNQEPAYDSDESPAYESGWDAYQRDLDRTDNPYNADREPEAHEEWQRGWMDALEEDEDLER